MINNYANYVINFKVKEEMIDLILFVVVTRIGYAVSREPVVQQKLLPVTECWLSRFLHTEQAAKGFRYAVRVVEFVVMVEYLYHGNQMQTRSAWWLAVLVLGAVLYAAFSLLCTAARNVQNKNAE